jgi:hypothetical protein
MVVISDEQNWISDESKRDEEINQFVYQSSTCWHTRSPSSYGEAIGGNGTVYIYIPTCWDSNCRVM